MYTWVQERRERSEQRWFIWYPIAVIRFYGYTGRLEETPETTCLAPVDTAWLYTGAAQMRRCERDISGCWSSVLCLLAAHETALKVHTTTYCVGILHLLCQQKQLLLVLSVRFISYNSLSADSW